MRRGHEYVQEKLVSIADSPFLILAGCGNQENSSPSHTPAAEENKRIVKHLMGETVIPDKLEKVVALLPAYQDHILALGEKPYGVTVEPQFGGSYIPYLADKLQDVEIVGESTNVNLEKILSLDPDLIFVDKFTAEEIYSQLEKIAPTIVLGTENDEDYYNPDFWQQDLLKIAEVYGKVELAKEKIAALEQKVAEVKEKIDKLERKKLAFLRIRQKAVQIYPQTGHPMDSLLYEKLGFAPSALTDKTEHGELSLEVIPQLDADYIFLQVDSSGGPDNLKKITESPLWKELNAVKNNRVFETDFWIYKSWGLIGRDEILQ
ncbi:MAG: iron-siderophore ABC transporter substrate-binding protein [Brevibacillus sp.]|nr:iron-siderophore ABC transporter substrate-binding protein [Brevibacillus sp.]